MSQSKQALRTRIQSVNSTRKITKAMEMIANAKLLKQRNRMEEGKEYAERLQDMAKEVASCATEFNSIYTKKNASLKKFTILFCSDLGLCGAYNQNLKQFARNTLKKEDTLIVIGTSLYSQLQEEGYSLSQEGPISSDNLTTTMLKRLVQQGVHQYEDGEVGCVQLLYTKFVNTMKFEPELDILLPCEVEKDFAKDLKKTENGNYIETLFEPDEETILNYLIPQMISEVAYSDYLESTTSEQGSRRMAMKTATDNADELSDSLLLEYNKVRQSSITQEITEIVAGSNAV